MSQTEFRIRLAKPSTETACLTDIGKILASGHLTQGVFREKFEKALCRYFDVPFAVTTNSGTSALAAMLRALGVGPDTKVALPDYGFVATANAVEILGGAPLFMDVGKEDLSVSPESIERVVKAKPDFIMAAHAFGLPCDLAPLRRLADETGAVLVEDSACAAGGVIQKRPLGCASKAAILSFHPRKIITTGEGGAVLTEDKKLAETVRAYCEHGFSGAEKTLALPGMNFRLPEISCAVGLEQMGRIDEIVEARRKIGDMYRQRLSDRSEFLLPPVPPDTLWNHQTFFVLLSDNVGRSRVLDFMRGAGIECNVPAHSISSLNYYAKKYAVAQEKVPNSRRWAKSALGLPCHEFLRENDVEEVCVTLTKALK